MTKKIKKDVKKPRDESEWIDIRIKRTTKKRLLSHKVEMEWLTYDQVLNYIINEWEGRQ